MKTETPILDMLKSYAAKRPVRLHIPGHKGKLKNDIYNSRLDITELGFSDNLYNPKGVIKRSQELFAGQWGVKHAIFSTNGSTAGIFAMTAASNGKILTEDRCHLSLDNAAALYGREIVKLTAEKFKTLTFEQVERAVDDDPEIKTVFLQSPNYFGFTSPLDKLYPFLKERKINFFVDAAHGAHFGLDEEHLPPCAAANCDAAVISCHKTLPSPTQTAVLLTNDDFFAAALKKEINRISTTSPSYILLAGLECAMSYCRDKAKKNLAELYYWILVLKFRLALLEIPVLENDDFTRIVLDFGSWGIVGRTAYEFLTGCGIFPELYAEDKLVLVFSMTDGRKTVRKVINALTKFNKKRPPKENSGGTGPFEYNTVEEQ